MRWVVGAALTLVGLLAFTACGHWTKVRFECPSPDKQFIATFYAMSGGGAAGWQYQYVNVRRTGATFRDAPWLAQLKNARDLRLSWLDASHLRVEYPDDARLDRRLASYKDGRSIALEYVARRAGSNGFSDITGGCWEPARH